jgi:hypothetical protein
MEIDTTTQIDMMSIRREMQHVERAIWADHVVAAGKALTPDQEEEARKLMRKTIGRSPVILDQLLKLGDDPKASRVLEADIKAGWTGTIYTTGNQAALSKLVVKRLPATLITELTFGANTYPLDGSTGWLNFKEQLIQLAMYLDCAGGTLQARLLAQQQDDQSLNEYVAVMSAVTSILLSGCYTAMLTG